MAKVSKVKQFLIEITDEPGAGDAVLQALAASKVNLMGICGWHEPHGKTSKGYITVIPADPAAAKKALTKAKIKSKSQNMIAVETGNKPGAVAEVTGKIAAAGINIRFAYAAASSANKGITFVDADATPAKLTKLLS
ncbi:MAG: hypothetical protein H6684_02205 [Deltaproteobacteria bacterium]|nr:hypothetical protein [bacterium]MCB9479756.1 hypothetical protein [Deltaproteobacteria bacterium]MCB9487526.1 hypothetical protein [Deltaproteobacteria bacterium]